VPDSAFGCRYTLDGRLSAEGVLRIHTARGWLTSISTCKVTGQILELQASTYTNPNEGHKLNTLQKHARCALLHQAGGHAAQTTISNSART